MLLDELQVQKLKKRLQAQVAKLRPYRAIGAVAFDVYLIEQHIEQNFDVSEFDLERLEEFKQFRKNLDELWQILIDMGLINKKDKIQKIKNIEVCGLKK